LKKGDQQVAVVEHESTKARALEKSNEIIRLLHL
jgi:hypothetical protein